MGPEIEMTSGIFIWGDSGSGKTRLILEMSKYLSNFHKMLYDSLEEGKSSTQQIAWRDANMVDAKGRILLLDKEPISDLCNRLDKRTSPRICAIDSIQYTSFTTLKSWIAFENRYRDKLFIINSQADGRKPDGKGADRIRYHCPIKIYVDRFVAYPRSRYGGNIPLVLWEEGARRYHGDAEVDRLLQYGT